MFFQVLVSNNHWNLLHFLWWQDRGLWKESVDHERCVYVFGTSSPSCSNYVLKRTFTDGKDQFGLEATKTLQNNFYVDDLQKSVAEENQAIQLRENTKAMFIRRFQADSSSVTTKESCSLFLHLECFGTLRLTILNLKSHLLETERLLSIISLVYDPLGLAAPFLLQGRLLN